MFQEPCPELITPQPGGPEDPLGESVLQATLAPLRVFEPRDVRLVIGRHQDPKRELLYAQAQADGVPMHRRVTGGGAVVLAPGMVVVALRCARTLLPGGPDQGFAVINGALIPALQALLPAGVQVTTRGHGDLALDNGQGLPRKILGASLRQAKDLVYYLGVLMVDNALPLIERYLPMPSRQPDYRGNRGHAAFCTYLGAQGLHTRMVMDAVRSSCERDLAS